VLYFCVTYLWFFFFRSHAVLFLASHVSRGHVSARERLRPRAVKTHARGFPNMKIGVRGSDTVLSLPAPS